MTHISPMLAVSDGNAAIEFYQTAFAAELHWHLDESRRTHRRRSFD